MVVMPTTTVQAQLQTGSLYVEVRDQQDAPLPGVTITLTGSGAPVVQVSDTQGQVRFLSLPGCACVLRAELEGFATGEYPGISVTIGRATTTTVTLKPAVEDARDTASTASPVPSETAPPTPDSTADAP